ncbi:hypothetical protein CL656_06590 [bacterium]|nr:hypothetical protein [bacterium]|tara:strand:+ start:3117 stop:4334 length:1218 start_codon:yes stop_codon:yes gene_type:complete
MIEYSKIKIKGDKKNSDFFFKYLDEIYKFRKENKIDLNIKNIHHFVIQTKSEFAVSLICEWLMQSPYNYEFSFVHELKRHHVLRFNDQSPDILIQENLSPEEDFVFFQNSLNPKSKENPNIKFIGEVFEVTDLKKLDGILTNTQKVKFQDPLPDKFYDDYIHWTTPSIYTHNSIGYKQRPNAQRTYLMDQEWNFDDEAKARFKLSKDMFNNLSLNKYVLPIDHFATRIYSHDRELAILEYLTLTNYWFWGAYNIGDQNSSTNVCRNLQGDPESISPAKVFTANNTPAFLSFLDGLPCPTENFVQLYGRRLHHFALGVTDGFIGDESKNYRNVDYVVDQLKNSHMQFLDHVIGSCQEGLKQIFSKKSAHSLLITEYIQRCNEFDGFFTKENVAALTKAAGDDDLIT